MLEKKDAEKIQPLPRRKSFLDKIFEEDLKKQANFVEFLGWAGLIVFIFLLAALWTVKFDVTVPADHVKLISLPSDNTFVLEGEIAELYASSIKKGQQVNVKITTHQKEVLKSSGVIFELYPKIGTLSLIIKVEVLGKKFESKDLSKDIKNILLRVVVEEKRLVFLFIEKQS